MRVNQSVTYVGELDPTGSSVSSVPLCFKKIVKEKTTQT